MRRLVVTLALCFFAGRATADPASLVASDCRSGSGHFARVELYFGVSKRKHENAAWRRFLLTIVTPRFPDGFTVLNATGQWRKPDGLIEREASRLLILLYRRDADSDRRIETIRSVYETTFKQRSVLRMDSDICASF